MAEEGEQLDFEKVMTQKIIPLLNEYFYNQRGISVYDILSNAIKAVPEYDIVKDNYIGVLCKQSV
jgi:hypothetical protein